MADRVQLQARIIEVPTSERGGGGEGIDLT
jgi:hypothetical protein